MEKQDTGLTAPELIEYLSSMRYDVPYIVPVLYSDKLSLDRAKGIRSIVSETEHIVGILEPVKLKKYDPGQPRVDYVRRLTGHDYPVVITILSTGKFKLEFEDPLILEQRAYYKSNPRRAKVIAKRVKDKLYRKELTKDEVKMWKLVGILGDGCND